MILHTLYCIRDTTYHIQYTIYKIQYTTYYILYTIYSSLYTTIYSIYMYINLCYQWDIYTVDSIYTTAYRRDSRSLRDWACAAVTISRRSPGAGAPCRRSATPEAPQQDRDLGLGSHRRSYGGSQKVGI